MPAIHAIHAVRARLPEGWAESVRVTVEGGRIAAVSAGQGAKAGDTRVDALLPAPGNVHSHSFQRAMAGRTETRSAGRETFWTWRETMYRFLDRLTPEHIEAIAALAFCEMQEAGYAAVGEFHYLHNQPGGAPYDRPANLAEAIARAAATTGIGLTLLPVFYRYGGVDRAPLKGGQLRFGTSLEHFAAIVEGARAELTALPADCCLGLAPHSLRAMAPEDWAAIHALDTGGPLHIHAAEQPREVQEVQGWLGARPVEWLLDTQAVDGRWCLIHATQMTPDETLRLAASGAVAGLCPITEANLGDGVFDGSRFLGAGGRFGLGSDSNVRISLAEEIRALEYSQRLRDLSRNVLAPEPVGDAASHTGARLFLGAAEGGARALGRDAGWIGPGRLADLVALDGNHPALLGLAGDALLDGFGFVGSDGLVTDLWSAGRHMVRSGRHVARDAVRAAYAVALRDLLA